MILDQLTPGCQDECRAILKMCHLKYNLIFILPQNYIILFLGNSVSSDHFSSLLTGLYVCWKQTKKDELKKKRRKNWNMSLCLIISAYPTFSKSSNFFFSPHNLLTSNVKSHAFFYSMKKKIFNLTAQHPKQVVTGLIRRMKR